MSSRRWVVVALALVLPLAVPLTAGAVAARAAKEAGTPGFCAPVKAAFEATTTVDANQPRAYRRAYTRASKLLRTAAQSAPKRLAERLRRISERYNEVVDEGEALEVSDISGLGPAALEVGQAVELRCGFTIGSATPTAGGAS